MSDDTNPSSREHVLAAAIATAGWIRARRASWTEGAVPRKEVEPPRPPRPQQVVRAPEQSYIEPPVIEPRRVEPPRVAEVAPPPVPEAPVWKPPVDPEPAPYVPPTIYVPPRPAVEPEAEPERWAESGVDSRSDEPSLASRAASSASDVGDTIMHALPRLMALVIVIGLAWAGVTYWPRVRTAITTGVAVLESVPPGSEAFVDGQPVGSTPVSVDLAAGAHEVEFRNGAASRKTKIVVVARGRVVEHVDWLVKPTGGLQVNSDPNGARVLVDGVFRGNSPLTLDGLKPGPHTVTIESSAGSIKRSVTIEIGKMVQLDEAIYAGSLAIFSPIELTISEGNRLLQPDERGRVMLSAGSHKVRLQNRALGFDEVRAVEIDPATTTALNVSPQTTLTVTSSEPAEVTIDGAPAGETPVTDRRINLGSHTVIVKTPAGSERRLDVTATSKPLQLEVDFSRP